VDGTAGRAFKQQTVGLLVQGCDPIPEQNGDLGRHRDRAPAAGPLGLGKLPPPLRSFQRSRHGQRRPPRKYSLGRRSVVKPTRRTRHGASSRQREADSLAQKQAVGAADVTRSAIRTTTLHRRQSFRDRAERLTPRFSLIVNGLRGAPGQIRTADLLVRSH